MNMSPIEKCSMANCAYNKGGFCRTLGITVGAHAECNTFVHASSRGGYPEVKGGIGACLASECKFNQLLECQAKKVDVGSHGKHADCETFQQR